MNEMQSRSDNSNRSAFWPLLILGLAAASWSGFQTYQLIQEHEALKKLHANQEALVQNAVKLRAQLDGIAADTQRLAECGGNANAQGIVSGLRRRGVTINPDSPSAGGGAEAKK